mmetsp:Transcript_22821/g.42420  ORF Transcript_22821/g.42420 Transcript_22821/m.42420 type:complete len:733 (+) Transcript_22821:67-2265(+)
MDPIPIPSVDDNVLETAATEPSAVPIDAILPVLVASVFETAVAASEPHVNVSLIPETTVQDVFASAVVAAATAQAVVPIVSDVITSQQPFRHVLTNLETVPLDDHNVTEALEKVQILQETLRSSYSGWLEVGSSPGFITRDNADSATSFLLQVWKASPNQLFYETCDFGTTTATANNVLPLPSISFVLKCLQAYENVLVERLSWDRQQFSSTTCDCIAKWHPQKKDVLYTLVNQTLEQIMVEETTECLHQRFLTGPETWTQRYIDDNDVLVEPPPLTYAGKQCLKLLTNRDNYVRTLVKYCMAAQSKIQIMTCYLFACDPAVRYILLDLLPHLVRSNPNLRIEILIDLMTIESAMVKSLFCAGVSPTFQPAAETKRATGLPPSSFIKELPTNAPKPSTWSQESLRGVTPFEFLQLVLETAAPCGGNNYQVRYWCARDSVEQYRIKNHAKGVFVDGQVAIAGGSNLCPTVTSALNELDLLVAGEVAGELCETFDILWKSMRYDEATFVDDQRAEVVSGGTISPILQQHLENEDWTSTSADIAVVRSEPNCFGDDLVLRHILQHLNSSKRCIRISMGHGNIPEPVARVLQKASQERGVQVQILFNSWHSSDLRTGQKDLLVSLQKLLKVAPSVRVYLTKTKDNSPPPPFLHAKYVVIDSEWSAVGSWNMWTRSAFHEIEHEALVQDKTLALELEQKFEMEKEAHTVCLTEFQDCSQFCPSGCYVCRGFGPFYSP